MKNVSMQHRDAYWQDTRDQLKSAQNRGDFFTLLGLACIGGLLWYYAPDAGVTEYAAAAVVVALIIIGAPQWFVTRRKRSISAARLTCPHCGHQPHDTEISEIVETRRCQQCDHRLD